MVLSYRKPSLDSAENCLLPPSLRKGAGMKNNIERRRTLDHSRLPTSAAVDLVTGNVCPVSQHPLHVSHLTRPGVLRPVLPVAAVLLVSDGVDRHLVTTTVEFLPEITSDLVSVRVRDSPEPCCSCCIGETRRKLP